nr:WRKY [Loropetalum chinense var. rubrum]
MENMGDWEQKNLIIELTQGRELAKQLQIHLNVPSSSQETRELLVQRILASYDKAISMLKWTGTAAGEPSTIGVVAGMSDSPRSLSGSPRSEDSDRDFKDPEHKDASRKRKSLPRWTKRVQVCPGTALEGSLDDGFSWRKYGQKDILGAKFPRGYYRCTHRNVQGCLATKQVQRSDDDPTIFEITYRGRHTCTQASQINIPSPQNPEPNQTQIQNQNQNQNEQDLFNFRTGLKVMTDHLDTNENAFSTFCFPSTSTIKTENLCFSPPSILDNNSFMGGFAPSFMSPATSGSNYFSLSPTQTNTFGENHQSNLHGSESELTEIISAVSSAANSHTVGLNMPFSTTQGEFDPNFTFGNPGFFS